MIDVRGTQTPSSRAAPAKEFADEPKNKSASPFIAGALISAIVLYVKAFFASKANASEEEEPPLSAENGADDGGDAAAPASSDEVPAPSGPPDEELSDGPFAAPDFVGLGSRVDTISIFENDGGPFPSWRPAGLIASQANDNLAPASRRAQEGAVRPPATPVETRQGGEAEPDRPPGEPPDGDEDPQTPPDGGDDEEPPAAPDEIAPPPEGEDDAPDSVDDARDPRPETERDSPKPTQNRAPVVQAPVNLGEILGYATLSVGFADLLRNAEDPDGDALFVTGLKASAGDLAWAGDRWTFDPEESLGRIEFTYLVTDGRLFTSQVAYVEVVPTPPILGTDGDDILVGGDYGAVVDGFGGNDLVSTGAGNDTVFGGDGDDHIVTSAGDDEVRAGAGNDVVFGGVGDDRLSGGAGDDRLFGGSGRDILFGDAGGDLLSGGAGADLLIGGAGDDRLSDGGGADRVSGDAGNDRVLATMDGADDAFAGGVGDDTLDYSLAETSVIFDLAASEARSPEAGVDVIAGFERIVGGGGDDQFLIGADPISITGGAGRDAYEFLSGATPSQDGGMRIQDFEVGDRIRLPGYEIFDEADENARDLFERIYGDGEDGADLVRIRESWIDDLDATVVEADLDENGSHEFAVVLDGRHNLTIYESA